jgi:hypothetical protein
MALFSVHAVNFFFWVILGGKKSVNDAMTVFPQGDQKQRVWVRIRLRGSLVL